MSPLTVAKALACAREAGCTFRLTGAEIEAVGISRVPNHIVAFLKHNRDAVYALLGGTAQDEPYLALIESLGVEIVYCTADAAAAAAIDEVIADAGDRPIAVDVETTPLPAYVVTKPLLLTVRGRPYKRQPRDKDRNASGLDPLRSCVRLLQLYGGGARAAVIDMHHVAWPVLEPLWTRTLVAHNAAFELSFLQHRGIVANVHCTQQAVGLLRGIRRNKPWSLAEASSVYLGLDVEKGHQTSDWGAAKLSRGQKAYAAADAVLAHRVWGKVAPALKESNRLRAYNLQRRCLPVVAALRLRGVCLDVDAHADLCTRRAQTLADARREWVELTGLAPPTVGNRPAIAAYLRDALPAEELASWPTIETGSGLSTVEAVLRKAAYLPAMRPLLQVLEAEKWLSTFGPGLLGMLNPATGRLHPQYLVSGAKSGRWSARNPNIQQIPHDPDTRRIIIAAPGQVFVAGDFSSMELRAVAHISGEMAMTEAFAAAQDLHKLTAEAVLGVALDELGETEKKQLRTLAKAINFGLIYGSGAKGLAESAWNSFGIPMSLEEAEAYRTGFFRKYPLLWRWMRAHADRCQREGRIAIGCGRVIETAWERHDSRGKCGLRYTLCCNAPVQGACADAMMRAVIGVHTALPGALVMVVHDELVCEVPEDEAEQAAEVLQRCMVEAFAATFPGAPVNGLMETKTGRNWADVH